MRLLIHGINYAPEPIGIGRYTGDMVRWLAARGHRVRVVTAPPYYPAWHVAAPYAAWRYTGETAPEGRVLRCPLWVPARPRGATRAVHLASFAAFSAPALLSAALSFRPDVVWVAAPALACAPAAWMAARLSGAACWLHVQDFELETALSLGLLDAGSLSPLARRAEAALLARFDRVSTICETMFEGLLWRGTAPERAVLFPNWVDTDAVRPTGPSAAMRAALGVGPGDTLALYSGNLGEKQGLGSVLEAAAAPALARVRVVLCGDGAARARLEERARGLRNVRIVPLVPGERLSELLNAADIHLVPQRADAAGLVMPSKLGNILAAGGMVLATAREGSELWRAVTRAGGETCPPDDTSALVGALARLAADPARRGAARDPARAYAVEHLAREKVLIRFEKALERLNAVR